MGINAASVLMVLTPMSIYINVRRKRITAIQVILSICSESPVFDAWISMRPLCTPPLLAGNLKPPWRYLSQLFRWHLLVCWSETFSMTSILSQNSPPFFRWYSHLVGGFTVTHPKICSHLDESFQVWFTKTVYKYFEPPNQPLINYQFPTPFISSALVPWSLGPCRCL